MRKIKKMKEKSSRTVKTIAERKTKRNWVMIFSLHNATSDNLYIFFRAT